MESKQGVGLSKDVRKLATELKENYKLSDFEALTLALKAEQNELFRLAFMISSSDNYPTALEAIANALGYSRL